MGEITLVIMAGGRGSRFGGYKQLCEIDGRGHRLIDYSVYDAVRVGFGRILFIVNAEILPEFRKIGDTYSEKYDVQVDYVTQTTELPTGYLTPKNRKKPWGTAHAVACLSGLVDSPFALINADDFYGRAALSDIFSFLTSGEAVGQNYAMVGYRLANTLSKNGRVSRGICKTDGGYLAEICERTSVYAEGDRILCEGNNGALELDPGATVSVNLWGFTPLIVNECKDRFTKFLDKALQTDPERSEFYLPSLVSDLIAEGVASVRVLCSDSVWQGVTYQGDREQLAEFLNRLTDSGEYPRAL